MGRKKNPDNKPREEEIKEKLDASRQAAPAVRDDFSEAKAREAFSNYWAAARKSYNRPRELEDVLWVHLKKIRHDVPDLFEKGIAHFGLKK
jgi:hypothetical protein